MVEIRDYTNADYEAVRTNLVDGNLFNPDKDTREVLNSKIKASPGSILVAAIDGQVVGNVYLLQDSWNSFIFRLAVRKDFRKQGIGSLLMKEAENRLKSAGTAAISLFIREDDSELRYYYTKRGYEPMEHFHRFMHKRL